jgi:TPR repeat protein
VRQLNLEQIALLCKRGEELLAVGDIAAARLPLRRAAEAGDARSALMLARTYDPALLEKLGAYGLAPDVALARLWYQRANELGAAEASERLQMLAQWGR